MRAQLENLTFDGTANPHATYTLEADGLSGLLGGASVQRDGIDRPARHGEFRMPGYRRAKIIRLRGLVLSSGALAQEEDIQALAAVLADGGRSRLVVSSAAGVRWVEVELASEPDIEFVVYGQIARYQLILRAPDPLLYGELNVVTGSTVTATNHGNFPASPVVEVSGPRVGYTITGPEGRQFVVTQQLLAGQTHRIDFRTGRLYRDGVLQVGAVSRAQTWTVPAKRAVPMSISSGEMTVTVTDTYI